MKVDLIKSYDCSGECEGCVFEHCGDLIKFMADTENFEFVSKVMFVLNREGNFEPTLQIVEEIQENKIEETKFGFTYKGKEYYWENKIELRR